MKRKITLLLAFLFFIAAAVFAQSADSITIVNKEWKVMTVKKGVTWKQGHFDKLFDSRQEINFVEIDLKKHRRRIRIAADPAQLATTSQFALEHKAIAAINGGFFDMKNGGSVDYVKVRGKVVNTTRKESDRANSILLISQKKIEIQSASAIDHEQSKVPHILLSGPLLVHQGTDVTLSRNPFNDNRHPRSAIAITDDRKLIFIVVDGRNSLAAGMRLPELAKILRWLGAKNAMNLDGGGSSTLFVKGASGNHVVNHPSDNKKFDHQGQRPVASIVYLRK